MAWMTVPRAKAEASEGDPLERDGGGAEKEPKRKVVDLAVAGGTTNDAEKQRQVVGDGGASWRMKALKRAARRAEEEGKKLKDVAADRWGSLRDLTGGITKHARESGSRGAGIEDPCLQGLSVRTSLHALAVGGGRMWKPSCRCWDED